VQKPRFSNRLSNKVLLSLAALGTAGAIAGLGTFASFTSTTSASNTATTGKVIINVGASGAGTNRFSQSSGTLVPGDTVQRSIDLISTSTAGDLGVVTLTTTATASSVLDTDAVNGLQMQIDNCAAGWVEAGTAPAYTYTCVAGSTAVLASRAVIGNALALANLSIVSTPGTDHLRLTLTLPSGTGNTFQDKTSTVLYTFDATQRNATNR
jgi:spore coat-associated protein N